MARDRKVTSGPIGSGDYDAPGSLVRAYAQRKSWPLSMRNVMLEGRTDAEYFRIADMKYQVQHGGKKLICDKLSLFQVGDGDSGGVDNIKDKFVFLREVLSTETYAAPSDRIMAIVLMDNDDAGRRVAQFLDKRGFKLHRDVFLIVRNLPRQTRDAYQMTRLITDANAAWADMDCEIEDLLSLDFLEFFAEMEPTCVAREPQLRNGGHHFEWTRDGKAKLLRFVRQEASYADVLCIVDLLRSLRYLLCLSPDGA